MKLQTDHIDPQVKRLEWDGESMQGDYFYNKNDVYKAILLYKQFFVK
jgi:hypothetical protein